MNKEKFLHDVVVGLKSQPKYLLSKYFYDKRGDALFEKIMASPEYYLTRSELEIFKNQSGAIADAVRQDGEVVDIIALGPGDSSKTIHLIEELDKRKAVEKYFPIDISSNIICNLEPMMKEAFPEITFHGLAGEYFEQLPEVLRTSKNKRLVFFVGATIGNFIPSEMLGFCKQLHDKLHKGDMVLIGFDLKKDPQKILAAYNDKEGWTSRFNLNLLRRINEELDGDFDIESFTHYPTYDPLTGACRSFLVSAKSQQVSISGKQFLFAEGEPVYMEVSQKYHPIEIKAAAEQTGFRQIKSFTDSKEYFLDVLWEVE